MTTPEQQGELQWRQDVCEWLGLTSAGVERIDVGDHEVSWHSQVKESPRVPVTSFGSTADGYYGTARLSREEFADLVATCGDRP